MSSLSSRLPIKLHRYVVVAIVLGLWLLANLTYFKVRYNSYAYDDVPKVLNNPLIRDPSSSYGKIWSSADRQQAVASTTLRWSHQNVSNALRFDHLANVNLHAIVAILFFLLLLQLRVRKSIASFLAAIYLTHPVHTEVVAALVRRGDLLAAIFLLSSIMIALRCRQPNYFIYTIIFLIFSLALLCSETALVGIAALPLLYVFYQQQIKKSAMDRRHAVGLAVVSLLALIVAMVLPFGPVKIFPAQHSLESFWAASAHAAFFFKKIFAPIPLLPIYHSGLFSSSQVFHWHAVLFLSGVSVTVVALVYAWRRSQLFSFAAIGALLFLFAILPLTNLLFINLAIPTIFAERYLYIALLFFVMILAQPFLWRFFGPAMPGLLALFILMNGVVSFYRVPAWFDDIALMSRAVADYPRNIFCRASLGQHYLRTYYFRDAIRHLTVVKQAHPDDIANQLLLAEAYIGENRLVEAMTMLQEIERLANKEQIDAVSYLRYIAIRNSKNYLVAREKLHYLLDRLKESPLQIEELRRTLRRNDDEFGLAIMREKWPQALK